MRRILADLFSISLVFYLLMFLLENIFPKIISNVFNLNYLLIPVMIFGVLSALLPLPESEQPKDEYKRSDLWWSLLLSILGGALIYYKIDLQPTLRISISLLSTLLIGLMSVLIILPEDYEISVPKIKWWISLILIPVLIFGYSKINFTSQPTVIEETIIRKSPDLYQIILINRSEDKDFGETYRQLIVNNDYKNITTVSTDTYPQTTSQATVIFSPEDASAGQEIADLLHQSIPNVQTMPPSKNIPQQIIIILK